MASRVYPNRNLGNKRLIMKKLTKKIFYKYTTHFLYCFTLLITYFSHSQVSIRPWVIYTINLLPLKKRSLSSRLSISFFFRKPRLLYSTVGITLLSSWQLSCNPIEPVSQLTSPKTPINNCVTPGCLPLTYTRPYPSIPTPVPIGLPVPEFAQTGGRINFGGKVALSVKNMAPGAFFEYSYDNGKSWTAGSQVPIITKNPILARTRINDLVSEPASANYSFYFQRILIIGNSIMSHIPSPNIGWYNNNGMAASAPEKDFVHLLTGYLQTLYPQASVQLQAGGNFERKFGATDYSIDEFNATLQTFKPDLIIVRIGENVEEGDVFSRNLELQFRNLLERLATYSGQPAKIICTTSVWNRPQTDKIIRKVTQEKGHTLVDLSDMVPQSRFFAYNEYSDPGVASHPNDLGMQRIADMIWQQVP